MKNLFFKRAVIIALSVIVLNVPSKLNAETVGSGNRKVCIDPGHQLKGNRGLEEVAPGSSTKKIKVADGTAGVATKKPEYQLTLEVGLKLRDRLKSKGYPVFMIRETNNVNISNKERALMTNKAGCAVYIRLHADGSTNRSLTGVSVLTSSSKNPYTKSVQKSSDKFSRDVLSEFVKATGAKNRGVSYRDDLTGTNWSTVTNTLIEMGFMSNPEEDRKMSTNDYQNKMVTGIVNGIEKYFRER
jgi:N-acetylmuramoyl-L-alanine amidase